MGRKKEERRREGEKERRRQGDKETRRERNSTSNTEPRIVFAKPS